MTDTTRALVDAARAALARLNKVDCHARDCTFAVLVGTGIIPGIAYLDERAKAAAQHCDCGLVATREALRAALATVAREEEDGGPRAQTQM